MPHEKIQPHHLDREAILYVRQSSAHQVLHNRESSALQYAMRERLMMRVPADGDRRFRLMTGRPYDASRAARTIDGGQPFRSMRGS